MGNASVFGRDLTLAWWLALSGVQQSSDTLVKSLKSLGSTQEEYVSMQRWVLLVWDQIWISIGLEVGPSWVVMAEMPAGCQPARVVAGCDVGTAEAACLSCIAYSRRGSNNSFTLQRTSPVVGMLSPGSQGGTPKGHNRTPSYSQQQSARKVTFPQLSR